MAKLWRGCVKWFGLLVWGPCLLVGLSYFSDRGFLFELTSHFRVQYAICILLALPLLWLDRRWKTLLVSVLCLLLNVSSVLPVYSSGVRMSGEAFSVRGVELTCTSINLLLTNREYAAVRRYIEGENPDVLGLIEYTSAWQSALEETLAGYPYRKVDLSDGLQGIALYSRYPFDYAEITTFGTDSKHVMAEINFSGTLLTVAVVHPLAPISQGQFQDRNLFFRNFAAEIKTIDGPVVVMGDFNCSTWSLHFQEFIRETQLVDTRNGLGLFPSWPAGSPWLWTTIDHCFVSPKIQTISRTSGPDIGSDHFPLTVHLLLPNED